MLKAAVLPTAKVTNQNMAAKNYKKFQQFWLQSFTQN